jgi:hypothetical protein
MTDVRGGEDDHRRMTASYEERALGAEALARRARNPREREAFSEIAKLWRRLAGGLNAEQQGEARTFAAE